VNDSFVMDCWGKEHCADGKLVMLRGGSSEFTRAIGLVARPHEGGNGHPLKRFFVEEHLSSCRQRIRIAHWGLKFAVPDG
jgi:peroxiredoxin